jgi:hypothetical protein
VVYWIDRYVLSKQELPCLCLEVVKWPVLWYQYEVSTWRNYITRIKHLDKSSFVHFAVFEINFIGNWNRLIITQITIDNHIFEGGMWKPHFCRTLKQTGSQNHDLCLSIQRGNGKKITLDYGLNTVMWWEFNIVESAFPLSPLGYSVVNCDFDCQLVSVCNTILFCTFPLGI